MCRRVVISCIILSYLVSGTYLFALYNRDDAVKYAQDWYDTDMSPVDGKVDYVNWPKHTWYLPNGVSYNNSPSRTIGIRMVPLMTDEASTVPKFTQTFLPRLT